MHRQPGMDCRDLVLRRAARLFWDRPLSPTDLNTYPRWVVSRVIHYGDLDDVRGLAAVMGRRAFLETIAGVRMQSAKVAALWDAVLKLEGLPCTRKHSRQPVASSWPP